MLDLAPELVIFAGAHFAGAGTIHNIVAANSARFREHGVCPVAPGAFGDPHLCWPSETTDAADITRYADRLAGQIGSLIPPDARTVLLVLPDLLGTTDQLLEGRFYPSAGKRAAALRLALGRQADRIVMGVRPYDKLFRAAWRHAALDGDDVPFSDRSQRMAQFSNGWIEIVEAVGEVLGTGDVTLFVAPSPPCELLSLLLPRFDGLSLAPAEPEPELTDSAVAMIRRHIRQGAPFAPGQRDRLIAFHARQPQDDHGEGFAALDLADLRGRYVADMAMLSRTPGVLLTGDPIAPFGGTIANQRRVAT